MTNDLVKKIENTGIYVSQGDITRISSDAIVTAINSGGLWFGGIDGAIQRAAGNHYHAQAQKALPLTDLQTIVAKGNRKNHQGQFDNVVFVIDDLQSPLDKVIYTGLEAASNEDYESILLPTIRMGVMLRQIEKTPQEAVKRMSGGVKDFLSKYGSSTNLEDLRFVVYNDPNTATMLRESLDKVLGKPSKSESRSISKKRTKNKENLQIGEMPQPKYLVNAADTTGSGDIKWIGMRAYNLDEQIDDFLWWRNFKIGNINQERARHDAASFVTRLKLEMDVESAIGLPVDLSGSDSRRDHVSVHNESGIYGIYVEAQKRPMFNFMTMVNGVRDEAQLKRQHRENFNTILEKAKRVLPYHK